MHFLVWFQATLKVNWKFSEISSWKLKKNKKWKVMFHLECLCNYVNKNSNRNNCITPPNSTLSLVSLIYLERKYHNPLKMKWNFEFALIIALKKWGGKRFQMCIYSCLRSCDRALLHTHLHLQQFCCSKPPSENTCAGINTEGKTGAWITPGITKPLRHHHHLLTGSKF